MATERLQLNSISVVTEIRSYNACNYTLFLAVSIVNKRMCIIKAKYLIHRHRHAGDPSSSPEKNANSGIRLLMVKFDSCNNLLASVHTDCIILRSVKFDN